MPAWLKALFARQKTAPNQREIGSDEASLWLLCAAISQKSPSVFADAFTPGLSLSARISAFRVLAREHHPRWAPKDHVWARLAEGELNLEASFDDIRELAFRSRGEGFDEFELATRTLPVFKDPQGRESLPLSEFFMPIDPRHLGPLLSDARALSWARYEQEALQSVMPATTGFIAASPPLGAGIRSEAALVRSSWAVSATVPAQFVVPSDFCDAPSPEANALASALRAAPASESPNAPPAADPRASIAPAFPDFSRYLGHEPAPIRSTKATGAPTANSDAMPKRRPGPARL